MVHCSAGQGSHQQLCETSSPWPPSSVPATEMVNSKAGQKPQHLEMLLPLSSQQMGNGSCHPQASGNMGMMKSHQLFMANLSTKCWLLQGRDGRKFSSVFVADSCTAWPGCAFSREQREEPCVLTQEQGQETLSASLLLVLLSLE